MSPDEVIMSSLRLDSKKVDSRDSACGLESWISSARSLNRQILVLSHSLALKNHDSSTTILES